MWSSDTDAERAVIGSMMLDRTAVANACKALKPSDFADAMHKVIFQAAARLYSAGKSVDLVTLTDAAYEARSGDPVWSVEYLTMLSRFVPTTVNHMHYVDIVLEKAARRKTAKVAEAILRAVEDESRPIKTTKDAALSALSGVMIGREDGEDISAEAVVSAVIQYAMDQGNSHDEMLTGLADIDRVMGGLHNGELTVLAARPMEGKSTVAWQIADNFAKRGQRVLFVSCEMSREQLGTRWLAMYGADGTAIRLGKLDEGKWAKIGDIAPTLSNMPLHVTLRARRPHEIGALVKELIETGGGLGLLAVDHLQLLRPSRPARGIREEVTQISGDMKALALEYDIPILLLSQLSRAPESRQSRMPVLSDLRESGSIEQDADNVLLLMAPKNADQVPTCDREEYEEIEASGNHLTYVSLAKHRNGPLMEGKLVFRPSEMRVYSLAHDFVPVDEGQTRMEANA